MDFTRNIKRYLTGDDVFYVKQRLVELGYLAKATTKMFGNDSYKATKAFQAASNLEEDGIVGRETWAALFDEPEPTPAIDIPAHIGAVAKASLQKSLAGVSDTRRELCLLALQYAIDPAVANDHMRGFYIRGGNLYDKDLSLHKMTAYRLKVYFNKAAYAPYYDGGRQEIMEAQAKANNYEIPGADCSGTIVGLWRKLKIVNSGFDAAANGLYNNYCTDTKNPQPGDLAWRSGHIGLVVGDYVVESAGGAYGIQLTKRTNRKLYSFLDGKMHTMGKWSAYGDPKYY